MGKWVVDFGQSTELEHVIRRLQPKTKQAMYGAAMAGVIKRGTWNGCAYNAGGKFIGDDTVTNHMAAAKTFGDDPKAVAQFIRVWDRMKGSDEECTEQLREAIVRAGLFSEPVSKFRTVLRQRVYTSEETAERELFEELVKDVDLNANDTSLAVDINTAAELLNA